MRTADCGTRNSRSGAGAILAALLVAAPVGVMAAAAESKAPAAPRGTAAGAPDAVRRGEELIRGGRLKEAVAFLREATARDPRNPLLHFTLAAALNRLRDYDGAIAALQAGVALAPNSLIARRALATAQRRKGDLAAARATLEALWRDAPSFRPAAEDLAGVMAAQGDRAGAIQTYRYLIDMHTGEDPRLAVLHVGLGKVLEAEGDRAGAVAAYREALRIDPKQGAGQAALKRLSR